MSGVLLVVMTAGSARAQSFAPPNTLSAGTGAQKAVAADLNGDGVPDLASANHGNSGSPSVSVFIGVGDGTFAARRDYPAAQGAGSIVAGDFNGDGRPDLAVANSVFSQPVKQNVSIFLNNGDGTLQVMKEFPVDDMANDLSAADFNKDGKLDLAVVCRTVVDVLLGNGDGTFQPKVTYAHGPGTTSSFDSAIVSGDFNGDGNADLAAATTPADAGVVDVLLGNGDGTFRPAVPYVSGRGTKRVAAGDLNGDGRLDLVTGNSFDGTLSVLIGRGDGTFQPKVDYASRSNSTSIKIADLDGDGKNDVTIASPGFTVLAGVGDGTLREAVIFEAGEGAFPTSVAVADLDRDGRLDLFGASNGFGTGSGLGVVSVLLNRSGTLAIGGTVRDDAGAPMSDVALVLTSQGSATKTFWTGASGEYSFRDLPVGASYTVEPFKTNYGFTPPTQTFTNLTSDATADFTGAILRFRISGTITASGSPLSNVTVTLSGGASAVTTTAADGTYAFTSLPASGDYTVTPSLPRYTFTPPNRVFSNLSSNRVGNFTGALQTFTISGQVRDSGKNAVLAGMLVTLSGSKTVTTTTGSDGRYSFPGLTVGGDYTVTVSPRPTDTVFRSYVLSSSTSKSFLNLSSNAVGDFDVTLLVSPNGTGQGAREVVAGDFNGDGKLDLAMSIDFGTNVSLLLGNGDGTFQTVRNVALGESNDALVPGDFDGDGKLDLALANRDGQRNPIVTVLYGNGDATFQVKTFALPAPPTFSFARNSTAIAAADMNGDGKLDLVEAGGTTDINGTVYSLNVLANNGGRDFKAAVVTTLAASPQRMRSADFNGDGKADLVLANETATVSILSGNGDGTFGAPLNISLGGSPRWTVVGDFNNDGKADVVAHDSSGSTHVLLGNGNGTFQPPATFNAPGSTLGVADFNGDGKLDLAVLNFNAARVETFFGVGNGTFNAAANNAVEFSPTNLVAGDFNGDGSPDLAVTDLRSGLTNVTLLANTLTAPTVRFGAATYNVNEKDGSVLITVTRTGDLSRPASVTYASSDGTATAKSDYTTALGTLNFAAGESSKSFTVFVTGDAHGEGNETLSLGLGNPVGAVLGAVTTATLIIANDDSMPASPNPVDDPSFFVRQHYRDFLGRDPDAEGQAFWTGNITECGADAQCREVKRINVSAAFFLSIEFQETGYFVYRTFKAAFGDATSSNVEGPVPVVRLNEFLADTRHIGQGVVVNVGDWEKQLESNKQAYVLEFVQRQRFLTAFPLSMTPEQFVDKFAQNAGITLQAGDRSALVAQLNSSGDVAAGRAAVLRAVAENQQLRDNERNRAFVLMQYFGYLRRNPDDPQDTDFRGWKFWLDKLNQFHGDAVAAEMVKAFISSDEYRKRFGQ
ncbi:MAG: FG-GAP-like repeat-containing protein [Pyrinomonadaceae bacterium]